MFVDSIMGHREVSYESEMAKLILKMRNLLNREWNKSFVRKALWQEMNAWNIT